MSPGQAVVFWDDEDRVLGGGWIARIDGFTPLAAVLPPPAPRCDNGVDDDGDGAIDLDDRQCKSAADNDESRP